MAGLSVCEISPTAREIAAARERRVRGGLPGLLRDVAVAEQRIRALGLAAGQARVQLAHTATSARGQS